MSEFDDPELKGAADELDGFEEEEQEDEIKGGEEDFGEGEDDNSVCSHSNNTILVLLIIIRRTAHVFFILHFLFVPQEDDKLKTGINEIMNEYAKLQDLQSSVEKDLIGMHLSLSLSFMAYN
jgi:hypothetical protein